MSVQILAIAGAKNSGKSALKNAVINVYGRTEKLTVIPLSFATPMKLMLQTLGVPAENLFGDDAAKLETCQVLMGKTVRHAMVTLATEWGRNHINYNMWVTALALKIDYFAQRAQTENILVVIDDLRFQNEYEWVRSQGGTIIGIERDELPKRPSRLKKWLGFKDIHISEQLPYRFKELQIQTIKNDGALADLHQKVISFKALSTI